MIPMMAWDRLSHQEKNNDTIGHTIGPHPYGSGVQSYDFPIIFLGTPKKRFFFIMIIYDNP